MLKEVHPSVCHCIENHEVLGPCSAPLANHLPHQTQHHNSWRLQTSITSLVTYKDIGKFSKCVKIHATGNMNIQIFLFPFFCHRLWTRQTRRLMWIIRWLYIGCRNSSKLPRRSGTPSTTQPSPPMRSRKSGQSGCAGSTSKSESPCRGKQLMNTSLSPKNFDHCMYRVRVVPLVCRHAVASRTFDREREHLLSKE